MKLKLKALAKGAAAALPALALAAGSAQRDVVLLHHHKAAPIHLIRDGSWWLATSADSSDLTLPTP